RFDSQKIGKLHVIIPTKENRFYPAPYGKFDHRSRIWKPSQYLERTQEIIRCDSYSTETLINFLNTIYEELPEFSLKAITNASYLKSYYTTNWLINSKQISNKEDAAVDFWKSRDIPPQETVFISRPPQFYFANHFAFRYWKLLNSVEIPVYLVNRGLAQGLIDSVPVVIADEEERISVLR